MYTKEVTIYSFDELSDAAKEKAREWYRLQNDIDYEFVFEDAARVAEILGVDLDMRKDRPSLPCIWFSGFCSQGDGACFEGSYAYAKQAPKRIKEYAPLDEELHRIAVELQALQAKFFYKLRADVKHAGRYYHEYSTDISVEHSEDSYRDVSSAEEDMQQLLRDFMRWIYRKLEDTYDWSNADEQVDDSIIANEYTFDECGRHEG